MAFNLPKRPEEVCGGILWDTLIVTSRRRGEKVLFVYEDDESGVEWTLPPGWRLHLITGFEANGWPS